MTLIHIGVEDGENFKIFSLSNLARIEYQWTPIFGLKESIQKNMRTIRALIIKMNDQTSQKHINNQSSSPHKRKILTNNESKSPVSLHCEGKDNSFIFVRPCALE